MTARGLPVEERFWVKVDVRGDDECWPWLGGVTGRGYGSFIGNQAHRWSYQHLAGPIPDGLTIDHLCRVKLCMNPAHMEPVTNEENVRRAKFRTHCPLGHEYTPENNLKHAEGGKKCRACHNANRQRNRARH